MKFYFHHRRFLMIVVAISGCLSLRGQQPNGGIITPAGDTITCTIALHPKDAGLKNRAGEAYLYDYVVAVFPNDSVRILYPGSIKAFFRKETEGTNISTNWYHAGFINGKHDMLIKSPPTMRPVFLRELVRGGYYQLWYFEQADPGSRNSRVFVLEKNGTGIYHYFSSNRQLKKLLGHWPGENKPAYKNWFNGKQLMVIDYNRYQSEK
jgi:hypothetical protein